MPTLASFLSRRALGAVVLAAGCLSAWPAAAQANLSGPVRGVIDKVSADAIELTAENGEHARLKLDAQTRVRTVSRASLADIKPGSYVGTAAAPGSDGTLRALEVHVFPPESRGAGEGHRAWNLGAGSTMTNGTVGDVVDAQGRTLTIDYQGGRQRVVVPDNVPVVKLGPGARSDLKPGMPTVVFVRRNADQSLSAAGITVGRDGVRPPM